MAKGSGSTKKSTSSSPKGLSSIGGYKVSVDFTGARFVEGLKPATSEIGSFASEIHPNIVSGGGLNSIAFRKGTSDTQIREYIKDVKALNKMYNNYKEGVKGIVESLGYSDHSWKMQMAAEDKYYAKVEDYVKRRKK